MTYEDVTLNPLSDPTIISLWSEFRSGTSSMPASAQNSSHIPLPHTFKEFPEVFLFARAWGRINVGIRSAKFDQGVHPFIHLLLRYAGLFQA